VFDIKGLTDESLVITGLYKKQFAKDITGS
jgi:hypothetical protein